MNRFFVGLMLLVAVACEKVGDVSVGAVMPGRLIRKIVYDNGASRIFEYDDEGRLSSAWPAHEGNEDNDVDPMYKVEFDYPSDGTIVAKDYAFVYTHQFGSSGELESISYDYVKNTDYYDHVRSFSYSDGLPILMSITPADESEFAAVWYEWEDGNLVSISHETDRLQSAGYTVRYTYSDIVNNFEVPLPFYSIYSTVNYELYPLMLSKNLPSGIESKYDSKRFSYKFDRKGIIKVTIDNLEEGKKVSSREISLNY